MEAPLPATDPLSEYDREQEQIMFEVLYGLREEWAYSPEEMIRSRKTKED